MIRKIIDLGAGVNKIYNSNSPLSLPIGNIDTEAVRILVEKGASLELKINDKTPLEFARGLKEKYKANVDEIMKILEEKK